MASFISGTGIASALGDSRADIVAALQTGRPAVMQQHSDWQDQYWPYHAHISSHAAHWTDQAILEALDSAGLDLAERAKLPIFVGSTCLDIAAHERSLAAQPNGIAMLGPHCAQSTAALKRRLHLAGPDYTISTACSSAANALLQAHAMLQAGWYEHALVVGIEVYNQMSLRGFASLMLLSQQGYKPFDAQRDGLILGEACAAIVLSREKSQPEQTRVLGGANRCAPENPTNAEAAQLLRVMRQALRSSGISAEDLIAIKAHGTGTPSNDRAEGQALDELSELLPPITSLKPYFGHTLGACGLVELIAAMMAWDEGFLPATPGYEEHDQEFTCDPITQNFELPAHGCMLLNSFGFGGNNSSLVIQR